jgi:hypothetical protein
VSVAEWASALGAVISLPVTAACALIVEGAGSCYDYGFKE